MLSDCLARGKPVETLRTCIPARDQAIEVFTYDRIVRGFDYRPEVGCGGFCANFCGDVGQGPHPTLCPPENRRNGRRSKENDQRSRVRTGDREVARSLK